MKTKQIDFYCLNGSGKQFKNTATVNLDNDILKPVEFSQPINKIAPAELNELSEQIREFINETLADQESQTVGNAGLVISGQNEIANAVKPGGFIRLLNAVFSGIENEKRKGNLTESEKQLAAQSFELIEKLTGKKPKK